MAGKQQLNPVEFTVGNTIIKPERTAKYLGVWLDDRRLFRKHVVEAVNRAERMAAALSQLMVNVGGPQQGKKLLYAQVVYSIILYGAPLWALSKKRKARDLGNQLQQSVALRVYCAYRIHSP